MVLPDRKESDDPELRVARKLIMFRRPGWLSKPESPARQVISAFARRAWRRPVQPDRVDELMQARKQTRR